ncbi:PCYCGC motif-containing (lipo)protein [Halobacillus naozhouensis]|uniref:PCYCGC motif-containing (Lipo)protein n=1 Tax=Halobacillus naozhouensis TaxID=554880 RepID=A0ABY8J0J4_9BACI|nr:PCYCGC motif-containing (lipo)protein [Halobacillus naozhouensis]WFT75117.1 PCYCGC motif-containing (lipo)protein [Halobacillus naozhouensis]
MRVKLLIVIGFLVGSLMAGCSSNHTEETQQSSTPSQPETHSQHQHSSEIVMGDKRVKTPSYEVMPKFLKNKPENMQLIYTSASQHKELLEQIPCYCGCGESVGHKNNYDCFIHDNKENGAIVWDDHGTKCGVCLEIAAQAMIDYQNGKSVQEIRENIDAQYKQGYAEPTPTPEI